VLGQLSTCACIAKLLLVCNNALWIYECIVS
jgi:hypothetical protein